MIQMMASQARHLLHRHGLDFGPFHQIVPDLLGLEDDALGQLDLLCGLASATARREISEAAG